MTVEDGRRGQCSSSSSTSAAPSAAETKAEIAAGNAPPLTFEKFAELNPVVAKRYLNQLEEVTNVRDHNLLTEALNSTRGGGKQDDFGERITGAIDWLLSRPLRQPQQEQITAFGASGRPDQSPSRFRQQQSQQLPVESVDVAMAPAVAMNRPGDPAGSEAGMVVASPTQPPPNSPNGQGPAKPLVDLTDNGNGGGPSDPESDLQRAIKLSLQDSNVQPSFGGSHFSQEDQDVSRALEASLMESQGAGSKRKRGDTWEDPLNPHDRERNGLWPVGLKNVGQTCWFSAVIQSLFYIPAFRNLVLNYHQPEHLKASNSSAPLDEGTQQLHDQRAKNIAEFMAELRKLFALMLASERKYVDPSRAVEILRGGFCGDATNDNQQEDVSEFTHILFAWMEEAFKKTSIRPTNNMKEESMDEGGGAGAVASTGEDDKNDVVENPMARLFFGRIQVEGKLQSGEEFNRSEEFTQHALQVNTFSDIHESLEDSTAKENLENSSTQERWFTELPPVLFFSLSRFQFNVDKHVAEKVHNRLDFPEKLFMDRYMSENKDVTRSKRESVRALKESREELRTRLDKFTNYGGSHVRLQDILLHTMNFAGSYKTSVPDVSMGSPPSDATVTTTTVSGPTASLTAVPSSLMMQVDSPCQSPSMTPASSTTNLSSNDGAAAGTIKGGADQCPQAKEDSTAPMDVEMKEDEGDEVETKPGCDKVSEEEEKKQTAATSAAVTAAPRGDTEGISAQFLTKEPSPRHVSDLELRVIQACMTRWKGEVDEDVSALESSIQKMDNKVAGMYSEPSLNTLEYRLHAVMVHEGSVNSGHYWAYVFDHARGVWLKFNDNTVNEATWDELQRESVGGHSNASAYSLVYLAASKSELLLETGEQQGSAEGSNETMEQGSIEALISSLPNDLAELVSADNKVFQEERQKWAAEQEKKKLEALTEMQGDELSDNNDCEVVEERLTYVNTHAKLVTKLSVELMTEMVPQLKTKGAYQVAKELIQAAYERYHERFSATTASVATAPAQESRLESFVIYLMKNKCEDSLLSLALWEQFSMPGLGSDTTSLVSLSRAIADHLKKFRASNPSTVTELETWHQAYHNFRLSAFCFIKGAEAFQAEKFDVALDYFTNAYKLSVKITEEPPKGCFKSLRMPPLIKYLCFSLQAANLILVKSFKIGDRPNDVRDSVESLVVPALVILQERVNRAQECLAQQPQLQLPDNAAPLAERTLVDVRNHWCGLLSEEGLPAVSEILTLVLEPPTPPPTPLLSQQVAAFTAVSDQQEPHKSLCHISLQEDLRLADDYKESLRKVKEMGESHRT